MMIDHIRIAVSNYELSKQFYLQALSALGYQLEVEVAGFAGFKANNTEAVCHVPVQASQ
jgi:catechol 2,3-dioxygenase-like lactoylglutathione lyase family enzyme